MPPLDVQYIASYIVASLTVALVIFVCNGARKWVNKVNSGMAETLIGLTTLRQQVETHVNSGGLHTASRLGRHRNVVPS
jgi:hypothetical protein